MINVTIMSPLPEMLGISSRIATVKTEIPHSPGITLFGAMYVLAENYPGFDKKLKTDGEKAVLGELIFSIDGRIFDTDGCGSTLLEDGCSVKVFMPYRGG